MADIKQFENQYAELVKQYSPKNKVITNSLKAFWVGGTICTLGQVLTNLYKYWGLGKDEAGTVATISLIFLSTLLTALNIYDNIGKYAGAGSIVPITGFANSMVSSAMEYKKEGFIYGMGAKLFTIAGPVIVFGVISGVGVGLIYYLMDLLL